MALNGEGEPQPTPVQVATQAATIELFKQWQTYRNGVHMDWDTFRSIDFNAIAVAVLASAGYEITGDEITEMPKLRRLLAQPSPFSPLPDADVAAYDALVTGQPQQSSPLAGSYEDTVAYDAMMARNDPDELRKTPHVTLAGTTTPTRRAYGLSAADVREHGAQVNP